MNKETTDRELEKLVGKMFKEQTFESPSLNFTTKIMSRIEVATNDITTKYEPLISKKAWRILGIGFLFVFASLFLMEDSSIFGSWVNYIDLPQIELPNFLDKLSTIPISNTVVYGILAFTLFLYVQIFILKRYLERQF